MLFRSAAAAVAAAAAAAVAAAAVAAAAAAAAAVVVGLILSMPRAALMGASSFSSFGRLMWGNGRKFTVHSFERKFCDLRERCVRCWVSQQAHVNF